MIAVAMGLPLAIESNMHTCIPIQRHSISLSVDVDKAAASAVVCNSIIHLSNHKCYVEATYKSQLEQHCCKSCCLQEVYFFGAGPAMQSWFADPDWAEARRQPKDDSPGTLYGGNMCKKINANCSGRLMHPDSGGYKIGFDFVQIFKFKNHSTGALFIM